MLPSVRAVVVLGSFGWEAALKALASAGVEVPSPRPRFGHHAGSSLGTLTAARQLPPEPAEHVHGQLTEPMLDAVLGEAALLAGVSKTDQV